MRPSTPIDIRQQLIDFAHERFSAIVERFLPDLVVPGFFAGYRVDSLVPPELAYVGANLHKLGKKQIGRHVMIDAIVAWLRQVDGRDTRTFYSYRVAETLLEFGRFEGNPLLSDFDAMSKQNLRYAVDSTDIFDLHKKRLRGYPNNYWAVLARCEFDRQRLGVLEDDSLLNFALKKTSELIFRNPIGFFDDSPELCQRYDIYTADAHIFLEPLWHLFDAKKLDFNLRQHVRLLELIALENGASVAWGRSIGMLSVCMTMELCATSLKHEMAVDPMRSLGLLDNAFQALKRWFSDDLINAHRAAMTDAYRGPQRLLQMTLDCLGKVCLVAQELEDVTVAATVVSPELFPRVDELFEFDGRNAGVWMFRNDHMAFQLPLVDWGLADYAPWFRMPGLFETPVDSPMICGLPRIMKKGREFLCGALPTKVEKIAGGLRLVYEHFRCRSDDDLEAAFTGRRIVHYHIEADTISAEEHWTFDEMPDAISWNIPETGRPLTLKIGGPQVHHDIVDVCGIAAWRSCWGELHRVHQVQFIPAKEVRFSWSLAPQLRVTDVPANHDYNRALYDAMPPGEILERRAKNCENADTASVRALVEVSDIFHVGWPEHLLAQGDLSEDVYDRHVSKLIEELEHSSARVVWTMHNRLPHLWDAKRGRALYEAWAKIADGVIHHSNWGMDLIRGELPYKPDAKHIVIPHGHYGVQMPKTRPRDEIESSFGLPPCAIRFGLLGRWQREKQVDLVIEAFHAASRPDQQLIVTAYREDTSKPKDPRIIFLPRENWLTRAEITEHVHLCDVLVSAHTGDSYLTSGVAADAIGAGIPMIAPRWEFFLETLGDAALYFDNTEASLRELFSSITPRDVAHARSTSESLRPRYAWPLLAEKTAEFFRSLC